MILIINNNIFKDAYASSDMPKSRNTIQKTLLESELTLIHGFFTAEEFHKSALKKVPHLGLATIYRFLNDKTKKRELHSYVCEGRSLYSTRSNNHCHYTCQICGKREHITINDIGNMKKNIKGTICHFQIDVTGVCENCMKKH